jgi:hypothetical protein
VASPCADARRVRLPAAGLEQLGRIERRHRDADQRIAEAGGDAREDLRVVEVRRRLDDRLRPPLRSPRLEDPLADEDAVGAQLHAERRPLHSVRASWPSERELLNFECDFPHGTLERLDLRSEFLNRDGGRCHRQTRASPFRGRLAGWDQPVHPLDQGVRQDQGVHQRFQRASSLLASESAGPVLELCPPRLHRLAR